MPPVARATHQSVGSSTVSLGLGSPEDFIVHPKSSLPRDSACMSCSKHSPKALRDIALHEDSSTSRSQSTPNIAGPSTAETTGIDTPQQPPVSVIGSEPPVTCQYCHHKFAYQSLRRHIASKHKFICERGCDNRSFPSRRDLERHNRSLLHRPKDRVTKAGADDYECACGMYTSRKDNHARHVQKCKKAGGGTFHCWRCDHHVITKELHEAHLVVCVKQKGRGRDSGGDKQ